MPAQSRKNYYELETCTIYYYACLCGDRNGCPHLYDPGVVAFHTYTFIFSAVPFTAYYLDDHNRPRKIFR